MAVESTNKKQRTETRNPAAVKIAVVSDCPSSARNCPARDWPDRLHYTRRAVTFKAEVGPEAPFGY